MKKALALVLSLILCLGSTALAVTENGVLPLVEEEATLTIGMATWSDIEDLNTNGLTVWLEEQTGLNLEFVTFTGGSGERAEKLNLMIAANQTLPDVLLDWWQLSPATQLEYGQAGILIPLNDLIEEYGYFYKEAISELNEADQKRITTEGILADGNQYGMPDWESQPGKRIQLTWYVNQKWLDAVNMTVPTTTDEFYDVLKAFKEQDPNGNGIADEIGLVGGAYNMSYPDQLLMDPFIYTHDTNFCTLDENNQIYPIYTTDAYRDGLRWIASLISEGLVSEDIFTVTDYQVNTAMLDLPEGETSYVGMFAGSIGQALNQNELVYDYVPMGPLTGPDGHCVSAITDAQLNFDSFITKDCKNPELAFRFLDLFYKEGTYMHHLYGIENVNWRYAEEGEMNALGEQAYAVNLGYRGNAGKKTWGLQPMSWAPEHLVRRILSVSENPVDTYINQSLLSAYALAEPYWPANRIGNLSFTEEENDEISVIISELDTWRSEAMALFCTGKMDIEKDWDSYVETCKSIGLDRAIEIMQAAYDRKNA